MIYSLILTAAGTASRSGLGYNKILYKYNGDYVINHSINKFIENEFIKEIIIVYNEKDYDILNEIIIKNDKIKFVEGSNSRFSSVYNGLVKCCNSDYVIIHDSARPFIDSKEINNAIKYINDTNYDAYSFYIDVVDSLGKKDDNNFLVNNINRENVIRMQTPQICKKDILLNCYDLSSKEYTDESSLLLDNDVKVKLIKGNESNIKITTKEDIRKINEQF